MCGIFGFVATEESDLSKEDMASSLRLLIKLSEARGREAAGVAIASDNKISIFKQATKASAMLNSSVFSKFISSCISSSCVLHSNALKGLVAAIGNTRLVTNGSQAIPDNNQPIKTAHIVGVHNGIITNDKDLLRLYPELRKPSEAGVDSDTRVFLGLVNKYYEEENNIVSAISRSYTEIEGSASVALMCDDLPSLVLATNTGSLYYSYEKERSFFVFGSEGVIVEKFLMNRRFRNIWRFQAVQRLDPFTGMLVNFKDIAVELFYLNGSHSKQVYFSIPQRKKTYEIIDSSSPQKILRRCSKCVLPESYPFIRFDGDGVCNYCRDYKKQEFLGEEALETVLEKYRSKNGEPDCIVGFSGGRDSSYGLHILKTKFGMNPVAYTFDWALVTDLARRNQAKVTGKLGIEHIIRAADIHTKRRHIRKNIYAWLKKPKLGMVPLFMAGDKMFYYYGRKLRNETGIKLTVFAAGHQVEQMEFKTGFCGIDQKLVNNTKLYHFDLISKVRLALWYVLQYLTNPSYLNESLFDSIFAFYSSFINKDDYLYLYRYIPWDEKLIERTLKEEYGWESDEKYGKNQWRMGDGHTALIDHIYHTVAGFSEFDNFRSNQIREGLITRQEALELIKEDNRPRIEVLQDFSQLIGFNLEEVLLKINDIPKLY